MSTPREAVQQILTDVKALEVKALDDLDRAVELVAVTTETLRRVKAQRAALENALGLQ